MEADLEATLHAVAPGLLRYTLGLLRDRDLAEEVAQEALTALVERLRRHGSPDCPLAFALAVARRRAGRLRWRHRLFAPLDSLAEALLPQAPPTAHARLELSAARIALGRLSSRDRDVLLLAVAGLSGYEAAALLGLGPSTHRMRLARARARLRDAYQGGPQPARRAARLPDSATGAASGTAGELAAVPREELP